MSAQEGTPRALRALHEKDALRTFILKFSTALKFELLTVWTRCDAAWRARIATMSHNGLKRELYFLLAQAGRQRIAQFYKKFGKSNSVLTLLIGKFVEQMGMQHLDVLRELMECYRFCKLCKYFF